MNRRTPRALACLLLATVAIATPQTVYPPTAEASTMVTLPRVAYRAHCLEDDSWGTLWAYFQKNVYTGARHPYRAGWTGDYKWDVTQIQVIGVAGDAESTKGVVNFNPAAVKDASQYVPDGIQASRANVEVAVYLTEYEGGHQHHCSGALASN